MAVYTSFSSVGLLCFATNLMVAVVSGTSPFYGRPLASVAGAESRGDSIFNRYYAENAAARSMQAESCPVSGAHEVCHTADLESDLQVHICPTDGSPCDQNVCYYSSVRLCSCLVPIASIRLECKSVTTLLVEGRIFNVTHYQTPFADNQVCVSISPAVEICDKACRLTCTQVCAQNLDCDSNGTNCQCREGFSDSEESLCCDCEDGYYQNGTRCIKFCRENCRTRAGLDENRQPIGECTTCFHGYEPPTCCNCSSDRVEVVIDNVKICKCQANLKPDDTCVEGALEPDCCECDTTGNATHAFYKNASGECIPFCKSNCAVVGDNGCTTCNNGFGPEPDCCKPVGIAEGCDKNQTLYFYVDATDSNTFENFCPLIVVMQMLVAAFNPSSTSGTKINALLFPDIPRSKDPSLVFDTSATCLEAIQGQNGSLSLLLSEFGVCRDNGGDYFSAAFPSSCGEGTSAVQGLEKIYDIASSGNSSGESALLMFTDGVIEDNSTSLTKVLQNLDSVGVHTLIAAGINDGTSMADRENLRGYTSDDNIVIEDDPIKLGIAIVRKLEEREIICKDHADNITASLNSTQGDEITLELFCRCHRKTRPTTCAERTIKYPTCGGNVSISVPLTTTQEVELDSLILEEEILAAVESVLERFKG